MRRLLLVFLTLLLLFSFSQSIFADGCGVNWTDLGQQFSETYIFGLCYAGNGIALASTGELGKILRSTDYGVTWSDLGQQFSQTNIFSVCYLENCIVLAGTQLAAKILRSTVSHPTSSQLLTGGIWFDNGILQHSDWCRFKRGTDE